MLIWSGWGIVVPILAVVAGFIGMAVGNAIGQPVGMYVGTAITALLTAGGLFLLTRTIEGKPGRVFIDEATGQRIEVKDSAGSLFFIPTRYWVYLAPLVIVGLGYLFATTPPSSEREAAPAVALEAPAAVPAPAPAQGG